MTLLHLTSNNTICDCTFMCPSKLFSSPMGSWHKRPRRQKAATLSLCQLHWVYKQAIWSHFIQYRLCFYLDNNSSSTSLDLTTACCSWMFHAQMRRAYSWVSSQGSAKRLRVTLLQVRFPCHQRAYQEGRRLASLPCSCLHRNFHCVRPPHHILWCSFLFLRDWTAIWYHTSSRDWTPLWHGWHYSLWCKSLLYLARSCHLVPLY